MPNSNPEHIIRETKIFIESDRKSEVKLRANGGNSILIVCEPIRELEYIKAINEIMNDSMYSIIDLNKSLLDFIDSNKAEINQLFELLQTSYLEIFKAPAIEQSDDLFKNIIKEIINVVNAGKVPILINTGALHGTGIECIHIMENDQIMSANVPLLVLYPATNEGDRLMFLSKRPASKYRCMVI